MGCASSKIVARSWRLREDVERRLTRKPAKGVEHEKNSTMPLESNEAVHIEIINSWELLAGLEEEEEEEVTTDIGWKRKAVAKELSVLEVPPPFEFAKAGSQKEWLQQDGQEFYVTPKFGKNLKHGGKREDEGVVFDPELVAQFERAMNELATDEEFLLRQIANGLE